MNTSMQDICPPTKPKSTPVNIASLLTEEAFIQVVEREEDVFERAHFLATASSSRCSLVLRGTMSSKGFHRTSTSVMTGGCVGLSSSSVCKCMQRGHCQEIVVLFMHGVHLQGRPSSDL